MVSAPFYSISAPLLHFISITFWTLSIFSEAADKCKYANSIMHNAGQAGWNLLNCIKYELYTSSFNATCVTCICDVVPNTCHQRAVLERDQRASDISADANVVNFFAQSKCQSCVFVLRRKEFQNSIKEECKSLQKRCHNISSSECKQFLFGQNSHSNRQSMKPLYSLGALCHHAQRHIHVQCI